MRIEDNTPVFPNGGGQGQLQYVLDTFCKHLMVQIGGKDPFDASQGGLKQIIKSTDAKRQSPDNQREWDL